MSPEQLRKRIRQAEQILARSRARFSELRKRRDPNRELADPGELRLMREAGQWNTERDQALHELARAEFGTPGITGSNGEYQWLSSMDHDLHDFARLCPSALLGRYLAVTSIDSGSLRLSDADRAEGWWTGEGCEKYEYIPTRELCPDSHTALARAWSHLTGCQTRLTSTAATRTTNGTYSMSRPGLRSSQSS